EFWSSNAALPASVRRKMRALVFIPPPDKVRSTPARSRFSLHYRVTGCSRSWKKQQFKLSDNSASGGGGRVGHSDNVHRATFPALQPGGVPSLMTARNCLRNSGCLCGC